VWKILVVAGLESLALLPLLLAIAVISRWRAATVEFLRPRVRSLDEGWDLVVMFEAYSAESHEFLIQTQRRGIPVFYDIDDYTFEIPASYGGFELFYERGKGQPTSRLIWLARNLRTADLVICSTTALARRLKAICSSVVVMENGVDYEAWAGARPSSYPADDGFVVGWHGSYNHWDDLTIVLDPHGRLP